MKFLFAFILFTCIAGHAQDFNPGGVTIQMLEQKKHPQDTSAPAAYLYKTGKSYFEYTGMQWRVVTDVAYRIKIYSKAGYDYANEKITHNKYGKCIFYDAATYNIGENGIEKTPLDTTTIITQSINKIFETRSMAMPNVKEGSIIEYKPVVHLGNIDF